MGEELAACAAGNPLEDAAQNGSRHLLGCNIKRPLKGELAGIPENPSGGLDAIPGTTHSHEEVARFLCLDDNAVNARRGGCVNDLALHVQLSKALPQQRGLLQRRSGAEPQRKTFLSGFFGTFLTLLCVIFSFLDFPCHGRRMAAWKAAAQASSEQANSNTEMAARRSPTCPTRA